MFMLIIWLQGIWLPDHGYSFADTPLWAGIYMLPLTVGFLIAFTFVFIMSYGTFWVIKKTYGMRVSEDEEDAGLDISEHGMYGYPEQFIPAPELIGAAPAGTAPAGAPSLATSKEVPA